MNNQTLINIGISVIMTCIMLGVLILIINIIGIQMKDSQQKYYPYNNKLGLISIVIVFAIAIVLALVVRYIPHSYPSEELQHFDRNGYPIKCKECNYKLDVNYKKNKKRKGKNKAN